MQVTHTAIEYSNISAYNSNTVCKIDVHQSILITR